MLRQRNRLKIWRKVWFFLLFLLSSQLLAQPTPSRDDSVALQLRGSALKEMRGYAWLRELCEIGPRLSGSENSLRAIHWAEAKLRQIGCDRVFLQPVMVPHWERGDKEEAIALLPDGRTTRPLRICALGGSVATPPEGLTAPVVEVHDFKQLQNLGEQVKGKVVFFNRPMDPTLLNTFRAYGGAVDQRVFGAARAARYGAVGVIVRSVTTRHDNVPHTGVMIYNDTIPKIPAVAIGLQDADWLSAALKSHPGLQVRLHLTCRTLPEAQSYNVVGDLLGSEKPEELIVVGGHIDSWDVGQGAHDDGAGCVQAMEVMDLFRRLHLRPKRTVRVVLFINEENGSRGSRAYAQYADTTRLVHLAAIESDRGGFTPRGFTCQADSTVLTRVQAWLPTLRLVGIDWIRRGGSGADVGRIKTARALFGYVPDSQRYFDVHHSANDVFTAVHPREFELGSAAMALLVYLLSEYGL